MVQLNTEGHYQPVFPLKFLPNHLVEFREHLYKSIVVVNESQNNQDFEIIWRPQEKWGNGIQFYINYFKVTQNNICWYKGHFSRIIVSFFDLACFFLMRQNSSSFRVGLKMQYTSLTRDTVSLYPDSINYISSHLRNVNIHETKLIYMKNNVGNILNPFQPSVAFLIETSHLICFANQMTGFKMKCNTGKKQVKVNIDAF